MSRLTCGHEGLPTIAENYHYCPICQVYEKIGTVKPVKEKKPREKPDPMIGIWLCRICGQEVYRSEPVQYRTQKTLNRIELEKRLAFVKHRELTTHPIKFVDPKGKQNPIDIQLQAIWVNAKYGDDELEIAGTDPGAVAEKRAKGILGPLAFIRAMGGKV